MIQTTEELRAFLDTCSGNFHGLDTEADSLHCYHEKLCMIQYSDGEKHVLIDPLAIKDLSPLVKLITDSELWMHGADYDITLMRKNLGITPPVVWDTQIAARLLGLRKFGYANLVNHFLGIKLSKASQKADWSKRPLTDKMAEYAINDVFYLKPMADIMLQQLHDKGRYSWFVESCHQAKAKVLERPQVKEDPWRIQGSGKLNSLGLLYLRALWFWRDSEAKNWNKPPFMVCGNKQIITWVNDILLKKPISLPKYYRSSRINNFHAAISEAEKIPEQMWPVRLRTQKRRVKDSAFEEKCDHIAKQKDKISAKLDIEPSLIISKATIESIAADEVEPSQILMNWQLALLDLS